MAVTLLLSALASASPAPQFGNGDMDLTELMNKFLAEYDGGKGNNDDFEQHQQEISYEPGPEYNQQQRHPEPEPQMYGEAPQYYRPAQQQQHHQYQQQQDYFNQPERQQQQSIFQQQQQQHHQYQQKAHHGGQNHHEEQTGPSPHNQEQSVQAPTSEKRQTPSPNPSVAAPEQKQVQKVESIKQEAEAQEEDVDPKLRDFTLIISKLLFQLSQL